MIRSIVFVATLTATLNANPAMADISVRFVEGAPKDSFRITNLSPCPTGPLEVTLDLSASAAGLIFDTTGRGAGVQVFQPFELVTGGAQVTGVSEITDGDSVAVLTLSDIPPKGEVAFTIDVDDTLPASANGQTMISGGEIAGAAVSVAASEQSRVTGVFDVRGQAKLGWESCLS